MFKVLLIGCGDLGTAVAIQLHQSNCEVIGVRKSQQTLPLGMQTIQADVTNQADLSVLTNIQPNIIIYCVAATEQSDENYYKHYVLGLQNVLATQVNNAHLKHVFFVSSTRVYGQVSNDLINEAIPALPSDFGGQRLIEAEQQLLTLPCAHTVLRLSGIYGAGRLYLLNMARDTSRWPAENHWSNRIHRDDACAFISYLVGLLSKNSPIADCYIVTDNLPTQQYEVLTWLAQQMQTPVSNKPIAAPTQGKRLSNQRMQNTGFCLKYPTYQQGYAELIKSLA